MYLLAIHLHACLNRNALKGLDLLDVRVNSLLQVLIVPKVSYCLLFQNAEFPQATFFSKTYAQY